MNTILTKAERQEILWSCTTCNGQGESTDASALIRKTEAAVLAKLREQEPVAWQGRMRPTWGNGDALWGPWEDCTEGKFKDYQRVPKLHDWEYQSRALYAAPLPAVVQVPKEFDYKHPRAQALIGADARHRIIIDLVWQILEDPRREFTASDMEYWEKLHDKVQEVALAAAPEAPAQSDHIDWKLMREARDALAEWANTGTINGFDVEGLIASMSLSLELHGKPAQAIPAPWREAVKVALGEIAWSNDSKWQADRARALLAQLDRLGGGE